MSEEYLEDETDIFQSVDDWDGMLLFVLFGSREWSETVDNNENYFD